MKIDDSRDSELRRDDARPISYSGYCLIVGLEEGVSGHLHETILIHMIQKVTDEWRLDLFKFTKMETIFNHSPLIQMVGGDKVG